MAARSSTSRPPSCSASRWRRPLHPSPSPNPRSRRHRRRRSLLLRSRPRRRPRPRPPPRPCRQVGRRRQRRSPQCRSRRRLNPRPRQERTSRATERPWPESRPTRKVRTDVGEIGLLGSLAIFVLAVLVGFEVISKVPATLHTPLMSGANSIHGIVLIGAMIIAGIADEPLGYLLAFIGVVFGAMNVV